MEKTFEIREGKVYGYTATDQFTAKGKDGLVRTFRGFINFDGMLVDDFCKYAYEHAKVVIRRTTLTNMNGDISKYDKKTLMMVDHMQAASGGMAARITELQEKLDATMKAFMTVSMNEAIAELGPEAGNEALGNRGMAIYREKYEHLVK